MLNSDLHTGLVLHKKAAQLKEGDAIPDYILLECRRIWRTLGGQKTGYLSDDVLGEIMRAFGKNPSEQDVQYLKYRHDLNGVNRLTFEKVLPIFLECEAGVKTEKGMIAAFQVFDVNGDGHISAEELREVVTKLGEPLSEVEMDDMLNETELDKNGRFDYIEFAKLLVSK